MNVPDRDDFPETGVRATLARFLPQTTMTWELPAGAVLFAAEQAAPTVAEEVLTTASRTCQLYRVMDRAPALVGLATTAVELL